MTVRLSSHEDYEDLLENYDTWMFDCDGVIWPADSGNSIEGVVQVLDILRSRGSLSAIILHILILLYDPKGKTVIFVTNAASYSRKKLKAKLNGLGIEADMVRKALCLSPHGAHTILG